MPVPSKVHAVETKTKGKSEGKGTGLPGEQGAQKAASAPSSPMKMEGPAESKAGSSVNPIKGSGSPGKESSGQDIPILSRKGQHGIRFYREFCNRGAQCDCERKRRGPGEPQRFSL